jgi:hypothetical protein
MDDEFPLGKYKVIIHRPEGPIKWEGFTKNGGYLRVYENGARTFLSREVIEDDILHSPGT